MNSQKRLHCLKWELKTIMFVHSGDPLANPEQERHDESSSRISEIEEIIRQCEVLVVNEGECIADEGEYLLLNPHWYRGRADGSLEYIGRCRLKGYESAYQYDLEALLDKPLDHSLHMHTVKAIVTSFSEHANLPRGVMFYPDNYAQVGQHLYSTDGQGILHDLGKNDATNTLQVIQGLKRLAGITFVPDMKTRHKFSNTI